MGEYRQLIVAGAQLYQVPQFTKLTRAAPQLIVVEAQLCQVPQFTKLWGQTVIDCREAQSNPGCFQLTKTLECRQLIVVKAGIVSGCSAYQALGAVPLVDCCGGTGLSGCEVDQKLWKCRQLIVVSRLCQVPQLDNFQQCRQFHSREVQHCNFTQCKLVSIISSSFLLFIGKSD